MKALGALVVANLKLWVRNRQTLVWSLVFPLLMMVLLGLFFGHQASGATDIAVAGTGPAAAGLTEALRHVPNFVVHVLDRSRAIADLKNGSVTMALVVSGRAPVHVAIWQSAANASVNGQVALVVQQVANQIQAQATHAPNMFAFSSHSISGHATSYIDFLVPGIVAMELMSNGLFSGLAMVTYREQGILRRIRVTPVPTLTFLLARIIVQLVVLAAQVVITLGVAVIFFQYAPAGGAAAAALAMLIGALAFIATGFFVAGVARTADAASAIANLINLPMMFLGGVFFPTSGFGGAFGFLIRIVPLGYLSAALRVTLSNGQGFGSIAGDLAVLLVTLAVATGLAARFFRWESQPA